MTYDGYCVGGPDAGKRVIHGSMHRKVIEHQPPLPLAIDGPLALDPMTVVKIIGYYEWEPRRRQWIWRPT